MHTDSELISIIRDAMAQGLSLGLHTLKASVLTEDRSRVEPIVEDLVAAGELVEIKKHRYIQKG